MMRDGPSIPGKPTDIRNTDDRTAVRFEHSPDFPGILRHIRASLAITTYQAGKLAIVGVDGDRLDFSFHDVEQAMGIAVGADAMAVGSRRNIHVLRAAHDVAKGIAPTGTFDGAWLTRHSFRTGNIHGHELAWGRDGLWVVNTLFSTLCTLDPNYSFVPRWRPPFITELEGTDRCHLNGLAMLDGRPKFVTARGDSSSRTRESVLNFSATELASVVPAPLRYFKSSRNGVAQKPGDHRDEPGGGEIQQTATTSATATPLRTRSDGRLRVGFLSAYFRDHTIGRLNLGRIKHLDRSKFEVTVLSASSRDDAVAAQFRLAGDRYRRLPRDVAAARAAIVDQDLDVLIFTDVGMDSLTATLAWSRMAPVQCVSWGHPDTTGSPHIDYFLSSELLEAADADAHYTEQLVRLPLLGTYFERPVASTFHRPISRNALASGSDGRTTLEPDASAFRLMANGRHTYLCPQTLFKFHSDFDAVLAGILNADAKAEIVLLKGRVAEWTNRLKQRFEKTLPGGTSRVRFLSALPRDEFLKLLAAADVILDPLHFGGGHTSYEALAVGTPVVTLPGEFLRSRITQALYRKMGFTELIVTTPRQYLETAVRMGTDRAERDRVSQRILETCGVLFDDLHEVVGLNDWLWSLASVSKSQVCKAEGAPA